MEMLRVTDTARIVTDPVLLSALSAQGIAKEGVEMEQDYGPRNAALGTALSPYAKLYRDLNSSRKFAVISGLPMVDAYGQKHELVWKDKNGTIENGNNLFHAVISGLDTRLVALSGQPGGMKKDGETFFHPRLFIGGSEVNPLSPFPRLLETDPVNANYHNNVLEWDYGICKRRLRLIEGRFLGTWVFLTSPHAAARIKYHQSGNCSLRLGPFAVTPDEEYISAACFDDLDRAYPFTIADTATFYPDANPETSSVDGAVRHNTGGVGTGIPWSSLVGAAGTDSFDTAVSLYTTFYADNVTNRWRVIFRSIMLVNTSALTSEAAVSGAVLSLYGLGKADGLSSSPTANIYSSNPASNTGLAASDYATLGGSALCDNPLTYSNWNTSGYNDFVLNASGLAAINTTGVSRFGFRNANYDAANSAPPWVISSFSGMVAYASEQGAAYKPKLVVTFSYGESKTSSDSGSGTEVITIRSMETGEPGSGSEAVTARSMDSFDVSAGSDDIAARSLDSFEVGAGSEAIGARSLETFEPGSGSEAVTARSLDVSEQASSADTAALGAVLSSGDTGSGAEARGLSKSVSCADIGRSADGLSSLVRQAGIDMKITGNPGQLGLPGKELRL